MNNEIETILDHVFPVERKRKAQGDCPFCGTHVDPDGFRDKRSRQEFNISGLCQECQDEVFQV